MTFHLKDLPYDLKALEPHISARTLEFHYGKHHRGYINKLNKAIADSEYADLDLEQIVTRARAAGDTGVFNNAAQSWNHEFLWHSMSPDGGGAPAREVKDAIKAAFGDLETFKQRFKKAATGQFGSGWAWLVDDGGDLKIVSTPDADTPVARGQTPLLTLDVWEHAYYLDYQNDRGRYVDAFLDELVNWDFAASNFEAVKAAA